MIFEFTDSKIGNEQHKLNPGANIQFDVDDEWYEIVDPTLLVSYQRGLNQLQDFIRRGQSTFLASMMNGT